jgi:quercetin dioxygenase-like cupin family protein
MTKPAVSNDRQPASKVPFTTELDRRSVLGGAVLATAATTLMTLTGAAAAQAATSLLQVNPSEETIRLGPLAIRFLLTGRNSSGSLAAFELTVPGRQRLAAPAHSHDKYEETIYGIDGVLTWTVDGMTFDVGPGQALCIPRGAVHRFDNNTAGDVKALCVITPAAIGPEFFRESAAVINAATGGPPDRIKMAEIMRRHGITPAPAR